MAEGISFGQRSVLELLPGSERMNYDEKIDATTLAGNVSFLYQGNTMYCDSAVYFQKSNYVKAFGKVHINKAGSLNLFCDSLWYNGKTEIAFLWGHVRARDQEYKLTTDSLEYNAKLGRATYRHKGKVESIDGKEILTSQIGYFYPDTKDFFFKKDVKYKSEDIRMTTDTLQYSYLKHKLNFFGPTVINSDSTIINCRSGWYKTDTEEAQLSNNASIEKGSQLISGDTLLYVPQKGLSIGKGNVYVKDSTEKFSFRGDYMYKNDSLRKLFITGHALAIQEREKDSLFIHADTLFSITDSTNKPISIRANYGVRIFQNSMQGICDSLVYVKNQNKMEMFQKPILWSNKGELKGDTMIVFMKDSVIERAEIFQTASALFEVDSANFYNQIAGKRMIAFFKNNEVYRADVKGNAQTIYYPEQTENTDSNVVVKRTGMNRLYATDLRVYLDSGEVNGVTYFQQPDGVFYPINDIKIDEKFVPNFKWNPLLRPKTWQEMIDD